MQAFVRSSQPRRKELGCIYPKFHTLGVDLGQSHDPTALCVLETQLRKRVSYDGWSGEPRQKVEGVEHRVRHLERLPLGMAYPLQVAHVRGLLRLAELKDVELVIDETGVGRPIADMFEEDGLRPVRVTITGGLDETREGARGHRVPKIILVSRLQAALHARELKFAVGLAEEHALRRELSEFRMRHTEAGRLVFGAREGQHDDLVLALAVAVWRAQARTRGPGISQKRLLGI